MLLKLLLGLRNNAHRVEVVKINGESRPVLGVSHPQDEDRRAAVMAHWGIAAESPRNKRLATIDEALPQRTQTILSHQLQPELRQQINSGMATMTDSRLKNSAGSREQADVLPLGGLPAATDD
jgi:hypothetical protein